MVWALLGTETASDMRDTDPGLNGTDARVRSPKNGLTSRSCRKKKSREHGHNKIGKHGESQSIIPTDSCELGGEILRQTQAHSLRHRICSTDIIVFGSPHSP